MSFVMAGFSDAGAKERARSNSPGVGGCGDFAEVLSLMRTESERSMLIGVVGEDVAPDSKEAEGEAGKCLRGRGPDT